MGSRKAHEGAERVYVAAEKWIDCALRKDDSLFTPGKPVWSRDCLVELRDRFLERPTVGEGDFFQRLEKQLYGCSAEAYQLMAEALYVHHLFISERRMRGDTKKEQVEQVLGWGARLSTVPSDLVNGLSPGLGGVGQQFFSARPFHVGFIIEFVDQWKKLEQDDWNRMLDDPWAFKDFVNGIDLQRELFREQPTAHRAQLQALLHLVLPDTFEGMVSVRHKEEIAKSPKFASYINDLKDDDDWKIAQIRAGLGRKLNRDFDFYDCDIRIEWDSALSNWDVYVQRAKEYLAHGTLETDEIGYKVDIAQRLEVARKAVLDNAVGWADLVKRGLSGNIIFSVQQSKFRDWLDRSPQDARQALASLWTLHDVDVTNRVREFCMQFPKSEVNGTGTRMNVVSQLLMGLDVEMYPPFKITTFNSTYDRTGYPRPEPKADEVALYAHALRFLDRFVDEASKRGVELRHRLDAQSVMWQIQDDTPDDQAGEDDSEDVPVPDLKNLAEKMHLTVDFLDTIQTLLEDKKQVIFQGPPGTGKTYVAREIAKHLAGSKDRITFVQFHPSYAYEDFVRGFRPKTTGDGFELIDGPLLQAAKLAHEDEDEKSRHFLVIDEINRGNIAKVFGELYFLLEYRDEGIRLQYQRDDETDFSLPKNLYIIGTMNTADRSIALVDLALRRRFYFVEFHPDEEPVKGVLRRWLEANGKSNLTWVADVVEKANEQLSHDRHAAIGPSYFIKPGLDDDAVERIWKHSVLPYIEERLFGGDEVSKEFDLVMLKQDARSSDGPANAETVTTGDNGAPTDASA